MAGNRYLIDSAAIRGAEAVRVTVEAQVERGIPGMTLVGVPERQAADVRARVRCALRSCGYEVPRSGMTVSVRPEVAQLDAAGIELPIAAAVLAASAQVPSEWFGGIVLAGGLGLDGEALPIRGTAAMQQLAAQAGKTLVTSNRSQFVDGAGSAAGIASIGDLRAGKSGTEVPEWESPGPAPSLDYADVPGCAPAKRALTIAAAGGHGILLVGPHGCDKSRLARRLPTILPKMDERTTREAVRVHSIADRDAASVATARPPLRAPGHAASAAALIGGGRPVRPGEVSLAHGGVLFLEDIQEFNPAPLNMLRHVLRDGEARLVRASGAYNLPATCLVAASCTPCPCGYLGERGVECACSPAAIERHRAALVRAIGGLVQVCAEVGRSGDGDTASSAQMREQVERARAFAAKRGRGCDITAAAQDALTRHRMRSGSWKVLEVARTIADIDESAAVEERHVVEALTLAPRF